MKLAFIGLGVMGYPMAGHLQRAGHSVIGATRYRWVPPPTTVWGLPRDSWLCRCESHVLPRKVLRWSHRSFCTRPAQMEECR